MLDLVKQGATRLRLAQDVFAGGGAEVQVGDDRRPHPPLLSVAWRFVTPSGKTPRQRLAAQPVG